MLFICTEIITALTHTDGLASTFSSSGSRLRSWHFAQATTDSMPMCPGRWSWRHRQPAAAVLKTKWLNMYRHCTAQNVLFSRQPHETCGQQRYCYTAGATAAKEKPDETATFILQTSWTLSEATIEKIKKLKICHAEEEKRLIHILICVANWKKNRLNHSLMHRFVLEAGAPPLPPPPPHPTERKKIIQIPMHVSACEIKTKFIHSWMHRFAKQRRKRVEG